MITPLTWRPSSWSHLTGCQDIRRKCRDTVYNTRVRGILEGHSMLIAGQSRSGKTAHVQFLVRCIGCLKLNLETLDPCRGECPNCKLEHHVLGNNRWESLSSWFADDPGQVTTPLNYHFSKIDCATLDFEALEEGIIGAHRERL